MSQGKLIHYDGFAPQSYDLTNDALEVNDRGTDRDAAVSRARRDHYDLLFAWICKCCNCIAMSGQQIIQRGDREAVGGVIIGGGRRGHSSASCPLPARIDVANRPMGFRVRSKG